MRSPTASTRETRSNFFRRAAELLLRQCGKQEAVDRYVRGYIAYPESEDEEAWARPGEAQIAEAEWRWVGVFSEYMAAST